MHIRSLLAAGLLLSSPLVQAQATVDAALPQTREQAAVVRAQAEAMRVEAQRVYKVEQDACYKIFLVNSCLEDARKKHTQAVINARKLEQPAREFLRAEDRRDLEVKEAARKANIVSREASQKEQAESYRQDEADKAVARDEKQAAKARKAEAGRQKTAAEQAKRQAKLEKRAQKDAERAAKNAAKAQKQAESDAAKAAEKAAVPAK